MPNKITHLQMIEMVIERMAKNSFTLKGWSVTLVVAIFGFSIQTTQQKYILIAYVPIIVFWFLDAYYLLIERKYKSLYKLTLLKSETEIDFDMDINNLSDSKKSNYLFSVLSATELMFYAPIIIVVTILIFVF